MFANRWGVVCDKTLVKVTGDLHRTDQMKINKQCTVAIFKIKWAKILWSAVMKIFLNFLLVL